jgi:hypothetical protein
MVAIDLAGRKGLIVGIADADNPRRVDVKWRMK